MKKYLCIMALTVYTLCASAIMSKSSSLFMQIEHARTYLRDFSDAVSNNGEGPCLLCSEYRAEHSASFRQGFHALALVTQDGQTKDMLANVSVACGDRMLAECLLKTYVPDNQQLNNLQRLHQNACLGVSTQEGRTLCEDAKAAFESMNIIKDDKCIGYPCND